MSIKTASKALQIALRPTYFDGIPLDIIDTTLRANGLVLLDEDGEEWQGLLCGNESRTTIQLGTAAHKPIKKYLHLSWYRMPAPSNRTEVVAYVS